MVQFNTGCCYLSGTNLPIKQIRLLSSLGTVLSGSFESVLSLPSHQHVHLSITFPEGETQGPTQNANHTLGLYTSSNEHWKRVKEGKERERNKSKLKHETGKAKDKTIILIYFRVRFLSDKGSKE